MHVGLAAAIAVLAMGGALPAMAQSADPATPEAAVGALTAGLDAAGFEECERLLDIRRDNYAAQTGGRPLKTLDLVVEGHAHQCEALRTDGEIARLAGEQARLLAGAAGLDADWAMAHRIAPEKFPDYPGRDRSQKIMRETVSGLAVTIADLRQTAQTDRNEARRLLLLAVATIPDAENAGQIDIVKAATNADTLNAIIGRMLILTVRPNPPKQAPQPIKSAA